MAGHAVETQIKVIDAVDVHKPPFLRQWEIARNVGSEAVEATFYDNYLDRQELVRTAHHGQTVARQEMTEAERSLMDQASRQLQAVSFDLAA